MALLVAITVVLAAVVGVWRLRPWHARERYRPALAWCWAGLYFGACILAAEGSGARIWVAASLSDWPATLMDRAAVLHGGIGTAVILIAYGWVWPLGTFTDGRRSRSGLTLAYGALWGLGQGLLFMSVWCVIAGALDAPIGIALLSFLVIGSYNGLWHRFVWDRYVSPPHNYREWNGRKVLLCHVPNLVVSLSYVAVHDDAAMFVLWQMLALALSARAMHFPAPWDDYTATPGEERRRLPTTP